MKTDVFYTGPSVEFLLKKCHKLFLSHFSQAPMIMAGRNFEWKISRNVILMGDALLLLSNPYLWPKNGEFKLWVLSESHKSLLVNKFGLLNQEVSVIPRNLILPERKIIRPFPDLNRPSTFVISSRLDEEKNIPFTLHLASALQREFPKLKIAVFSPSRKSKEFRLLLEEYSWKKKPSYYGDRGFNWHEAPLQNPFLVNFSTYPMEDFGVSVAQARNKGWPVILSDWGAFKEVGVRSHIRVNVDQIQIYKSLKTKRSKDALIKTVLQNLDYSSLNITASESKLLLTPPKPIKASRLTKLQRLLSEITR